jgi:biopolymer transport protein ExbD
MSVREFRALLRLRARAGEAPAGVAVEADADAPTECVVRVLDACAAEGVRRFGLATGDE